MVWFKVDDGFARSKKVLSIPRARRAAAAGVWLLAGSWASAELTDGFVPDYALDEIPSASKCKRDLIESGLWREMEGGIQFHNWHDFNPTAEEVEADRARNAARQKAFRDKKRAERDAVSNASRNALRTPLVTAPGVTVPRPDPTRPDPTVVPTELLSTPSPTVRGARGTRLPDGWTPSLDLIVFVRNECPDIDGRSETASFCDYWHALPGKNALKLDWSLTYQKWMRTQQTKVASRAGPRHTAAGAASRPSTTDQRINDGRDVIRRLAEQEATQERNQIGAS